MAEIDANVLIEMFHTVSVFAVAVLGYALYLRFTSNGSGVVARLLMGVLFGGASVLSMATPVEIQPGVLVDGRAVMIALAGPFGGPLATAVAVVFSGTYRWSVGGVGVWAGLGSILLAATIGCAHRRLIGNRSLAPLAIMVGVIPPFSLFLLPGDLGPKVYANVALPLLLTNAIGIMLIGTLLRTEQRRQQLETANIDASQRLTGLYERVQESEERFRAIHDTLADGVITIDANGVIQSANPACVRLFGHSSEALRGANVSILMPDTVAGAHTRYITTYLEGGPPGIIGQGREVIGRRADGSCFPMYLAISRFEIRGEVRFTGVVQDISSRKAAEDALLRSESRFRDLIEGSIQGVCIHCRMVPLFANDAFARMFGYVSVDEVLALPSLLDTVDPESREGVTALFESVRGGGEAPYASRVRSRRRDGSPIWTDMMTRLVDWDGEPAIQSIFINVTEQVQVEDSLKRQAATMASLREEAETNRKRAEAASAAKSRFLATMSHELRTPMAGINGIVELLRDGRNDADRRPLLASLQESARTLSGLLDDLLDFSQFDMDEIQLDPVDFSPRPVVEEAVRSLQHRTAEKGLAVRVSIGAGVPMVVHGDKVRFRQLVTNLVGNALKFTEQGNVEVSMDALPMDGGGWRLRVRVRDTGIGMSQEHVHVLFSPFYQADASSTRRYGGAGLGLAICRRVAEAMGGDIRLVRSDDTGSVFEFEVPVTAATGTTPDVDGREDATTAVRAAGLRILLAEDNDINRLVIARMIQNKTGHEVTCVVNGQQAVDAVEHRDFDLVLMDMQMPVLDGRDATRRIRTLPGGKADIPILALTADALPQHRSMYLDAGVNEVLTKPLDWKALENAIARFGGRAEAAFRVTGHGDRADAGRSAGSLDFTRLDQLVQGLGADGALMLAGQLPEQIRTTVAMIGHALGDGRLDEARRAAHTLAGLVGTFGAHRLQEVCRTIENSGANLVRARTAFPELTLTAHEAERDLTIWIAELGRTIAVSAPDHDMENADAVPAVH